MLHQNSRRSSRSSRRYSSHPIEVAPGILSTDYTAKVFGLVPRSDEKSTETSPKRKRKERMKKIKKKLPKILRSGPIGRDECEQPAEPSSEMGTTRAKEEPDSRGSDDLVDKHPNPWTGVLSVEPSLLSRQSMQDDVEEDVGSDSVLIQGSNRGRIRRGLLGRKGNGLEIMVGRDGDSGSGRLTSAEVAVPSRDDKGSLLPKTTGPTKSLSDDVARIVSLDFLPRVKLTPPTEAAKMAKSNQPIASPTNRHALHSLSNHVGREDMSSMVRTSLSAATHRGRGLPRRASRDLDRTPKVSNLRIDRVGAVGPSRPPHRYSTLQSWQSTFPTNHIATAPCSHRSVPQTSATISSGDDIATIAGRIAFSTTMTRQTSPCTTRRGGVIAVPAPTIFLARAASVASLERCSSLIIPRIRGPTRQRPLPNSVGHKDNSVERRASHAKAIQVRTPPRFCTQAEWQKPSRTNSLAGGFMKGAKSGADNVFECFVRPAFVATESASSASRDLLVRPSWREYTKGCVFLLLVFWLGWIAYAALKGLENILRVVLIPLRLVLIILGINREHVSR